MNYFKNDCLAGKTFLITGASSGIGQATAQKVAECGGLVVISGRDNERLNATLDKLPGKDHVASACDLRDADQAFDWTKTIIGKSGALSGVFHCAGIELIRPIKMLKQAHLDQILGSSLMASFGIARALSQKNALNDGASMVFMSSVAGSTGQVGMTAYSAAKAGVDGLVRSLACEMAPRKIRVNSIASGAVKTAMHDRLTKGGGEDATAAYEQSHLLGFGEVDDIAQAATFLLSDASRWITGTTLVVDGGYMVR